MHKADPFRRSNFEPRSPHPTVHALTKRFRQQMIDAYREFETAYRIASERFRSG